MEQQATLKQDLAAKIGEMVDAVHNEKPELQTKSKSDGTWGGKLQRALGIA